MLKTFRGSMVYPQLNEEGRYVYPLNGGYIPNFTVQTVGTSPGRETPQTDFANVTINYRNEGSQLSLPALSDIAVSYTSPGATSSFTAGTVLLDNGIFFRGRYIAQPQLPQYKLPPRKKLVPPRLRVFKIGPFLVPRKRPTESEESWRTRVLLAEEAYNLESRRRRRAVATINAGRMAQYRIKVQRRKAFVDRYNAVYQRRLAKFKRRSRLYNERRARLLQVKDRQKPRRDIFHSHFLFKMWDCELIPMIFEGFIVTDSYWGTNAFLYEGRPDAPYADLLVHGSSTMLYSELEEDGVPQLDTVFPVDVASTLRAKLQYKLSEKVKQQEFHLGCMMAEYRQTVELLSESFKGIMAFAKAPMRATFQPARLTSLGNISNQFLKYVFGVEPLISDLQGVYNALKNASTLMIAGRFKVRSQVLHFYRGPINVGGIIVNVEGALTVRRVVSYSVDNPLLYLFNRLGLVNPAEVAWEVTPWSFVLDWFLPIGKAISSLSSEVGLTVDSNFSSESYSFKGIVLERRLFEDVTFQIPRFEGVRYGFLAVGGGGISVKGRYKYDPDRLPSLTVLPKHFGLKRLGESAALTYQRLSKVVGKLVRRQ